MTIISLSALYVCFLSAFSDNNEVESLEQVVQVDENTAARAAEWHADAHAQSPGVDSPQPTDLFYKLQVQECFFVGGMGSNAAAEVLSAQVRLHSV